MLSRSGAFWKSYTLKLCDNWTEPLDCMAKPNPKSIISYIQADSTKPSCPSWSLPRRVAQILRVNAGLVLWDFTVQHFPHHYTKMPNWISGSFPGSRAFASPGCCSSHTNGMSMRIHIYIYTHISMRVYIYIYTYIYIYRHMYVHIYIRPAKWRERQSEQSHVWSKPLPSETLSC